MTRQFQFMRVPLCLVVAILLSGCETMAYYSQSVVGHSKLMLARQPIDEVISKSNDKKRATLLLAKQLRSFSVDALSLPNNSSYSSFVDLKREYPVWSVVAAAEFSTLAINWCFPVAGCTSYRGYFAEKDALKFERKLQHQGFETVVGGAPAYSTLVWFSDPLIPSMYAQGEIALAEVMFHELAHQQFYFKGDSAFNEAFATVVGEQGVLKWLQRVSPDKVRVYKELLQVRIDFSSLISDTKFGLQQLYEKVMPDSVKREEKQKLLNDMLKKYQHLKDSQWAGKGWYGAWFDEPVNNARLAAFSTYRELA